MTNAPRRKRAMASLYSVQWMLMAAFNSVYTGSRSSRGTEIRAFDAFWVVTGGGATGCLVAEIVDDEVVPVSAAGSICIVLQGQKGTSRARGCAKPEEDVD